MKTSKPTGTRGKASGACSKCGGGGVKGWGGLREKCMGSVEGWCRVVQGGGGGGYGIEMCQGEGCRGEVQE